MKDLFRTDDCFYSDATYWSTSTLVNSWKTTMCNDSYPIMGGYNVLSTPLSPVTNQIFSRTYNDLPTHTYIFFAITIYAVDTWDDIRSDDDYFTVTFDGAATAEVHGLVMSRFFEDLCGVPGWRNDLRNLRIFGYVTHTASSVTLRVVSGVHQVGTDESLGFRDVNLIFATPSPAPTTAAPYLCAVGPGPVADITPLCSCPEGQYLSGTCTDCHSYCLSCYGAGADKCYQCRSGYSYYNGACIPCYPTCNSCTGTGYNECIDCMAGYFLYDGNQCVFPCNAPLRQESLKQLPGTCTQTCSSPCDNPYDYMYWDGSCNSTCPSPLKKSVTLGNIPTCSYPCADGQFLYVSGKCATTCTSPLLPVKINGQQFCFSPCTNAGEFLLWNSTCTTVCDFPLTYAWIDDVLYCQYPCTNIGTDYLYWDGYCISTCPSPLTERSENGYLFCDFGLDDTTAYLYWNGTGASTCASPLTSHTEGTLLLRKICDYGCSLTQYLYWDGSCQSSCPFPYVYAYEGERNFCRYPCAATEFLYWNGSCLDSCPSPFIPSTPYGSNFCGYTCSSSQYLYWDDSCLPSCAWPLIATNMGTTTSLYCVYPCKATEFVYWNGTCSDSCDFPLAPQVYKTKNFCEYPCAETQFLYFNGTCSDNCMPPYEEYRENGKGFCNYPCSATEFLFWNGTCFSDCDSPLIKSTGTYGEKYCLTPCVNPLHYYVVETGQCWEECDTNSTIYEELYLRCAMYVAPSPDYGFLNLITASGASYSFISMAKLSQHVRYLEVNQPPRLEALSQSHSRPIITLKFLPDMPESLKSKFTLRSLPTVFSRLGLHSSFLVNYWASLMTLAAGIVVAFLLWGIALIVKYTENIEVPPFLDNLLTLFKWNFCFVLIVSNVDDIVIFGYIDFVSMQLKNANATLSLFMILLMICLVVATLVIAFLLVWKFQSMRKQVQLNKNFDLYEEFLVKWRSWQVLFRGYFEDTFVKQSFYIIYIVRLGLPMLITVTFLTKPVSQSVCQLIVSLDILVYILYRCPFRRRINYVQLMIVESLVFVINICCVILSIKDFEDSDNYKIRVWVGDVIVLCNFSINVTRVVFFFVKFFIEIGNIRTLERIHPTKSNARWLRLLAIPLEQGAFGFEEILENVWYARYCAQHPEIDLLSPPPESLYPAAEQDESHAELKSDIQKKGKIDLDEPVFHFPHNAEYYNSYGNVDRVTSDFYNNKIQSIKKKNPLPKRPQKPEVEEIHLDNRRSPNDTMTSLHGKPVNSSFAGAHNSEPIPLSEALGMYDKNYNYDRDSPAPSNFKGSSPNRLRKRRSPIATRASVDEPLELNLDSVSNNTHQNNLGDSADAIKESMVFEHDSSQIHFMTRDLSRVSSQRPIVIKKQIGSRDRQKRNTTIFNRADSLNSQKDDL